MSRAKSTVQHIKTTLLNRAGTVYRNTDNITICLLRNSYQFLHLLPKIIVNLLWLICEHVSMLIQHNKPFFMSNVVVFLSFSAAGCLTFTAQENALYVCALQFLRLWIWYTHAHWCSKSLCTHSVQFLRLLIVICYPLLPETLSWWHQIWPGERRKLWRFKSDLLNSGLI